MVIRCLSSKRLCHAVPFYIAVLCIRVEYAQIAIIYVRQRMVNWYLKGKKQPDMVDAVLQ